MTDAGDCVDPDPVGSTSTHRIRSGFKNMDMGFRPGFENNKRKQLRLNSVKILLLQTNMMFLLKILGSEYKRNYMDPQPFKYYR